MRTPLSILAGPALTATVASAAGIARNVRYAAGAYRVNGIAGGPADVGPAQVAVSPTRA